MNAPKILLVDDEESILNSCRRLLRKDGYQISATTSPGEALELLKKETFAVILSDMRMPEMLGSELLAKAYEICPETIRIILTGYAEVQSAVDAINQGKVNRYLGKPWNDEDLRAVIRQGVDQYLLIQENEQLQELTEKQNLELQDLNKNLEQRVVERTKEISRLNQELEEGFLQTVQVLADLAEIHSSVIGSHASRVSKLSKKIGEKLGLKEKELFDLEIAASLHDIGKVGVPTEILKKPESSLNARENALARQHVIQGEMILSQISSLGIAAKIVRHHHEHFDGSGYPDNLKQSKIPLGSRIIAVVDAYDKILNARTDFDSTTTGKALDLVQDHCPQWYDPEIVACLKTCVLEDGADYDEAVEIEVFLRDLCPGMIISRDLFSANAVLLIPKDTEITSAILASLRNNQSGDPVVDQIFVYRKNQS